MMEDMNELEVYVKTEIGEVLLGTVAEILFGDGSQAELKQILIDVVGNMVGETDTKLSRDFYSYMKIELREPTGF